MNTYAIPSLVAALVTLYLSLFVFSKNKENPVNRTFALLILCITIWNVGIMGIRGAPNDDFAETWGDIFRPGLLFVPAAALHFTIHFLKLKQQKNIRLLVRLAYGNSIIFSGLNWTPYFTQDAIKYKWGYTIQTGSLYPWFMGTFFFFMGISFLLLIRNYFRVDQYQKQRIKFFLMALIFCFLLGSVSFLPMLGVEIFPLGNLAVAAGLILAAYSVVQHRLMDVSVFMAKGLSYILTFAILAFPFFFIILALESFFFQREGTAFIFILMSFGVAAILLFNLIKGRMDRAMHQIILKDKYNYHLILEEFSRRLVTIVDLSRLLNMLADTIEKSLGVHQISICLREQEKDMYQVRLARGSPAMESIKISEAASEYLQERTEAILRAELEWGRKEPGGEELAGIMRKFGAEVCLPLVSQNRLIGFINLGPKMPEAIYFEEDLDLLYPLANQVAIAIENSNLYENLKKSQSIMRRADRLASLGTLIASLAHEIRNPLVSIKTFTQLLPERIEDEEFRNYFLKVASGEIDRLTGLINELLGFARPSEPRLEGEDVNALIDKMEILVATEARKKNVTLNKNYARDLPQIRVDAEQLKQVLLNILLNAIQAIKGEGKIWIETRRVQVPIEDRVEPFTQIEVRDSGVGIPRENLERIFDPFFSTRTEGSGLGLAISHQIIHDHGGFISVESEVGKGTSFKVHLPLKPGGVGANPN
ncbi:MAG: ATP-binding protein [Planctomycetaceae bacterium]